MAAMPRICRRKQAGYVLLMAIFIVATLLILAAAAVPSVLTQGRREMETEMVWRGQQYQRAIGLYYRKFGKYPTKIEDLTRQTNGVRFLRQAYTDPMNKEDGSWRFIYVGPNGQLIGSVRQTSVLQNSVSGAGVNSLFGPGLQPPGPPQQGTTAGAGGTPGAPGGPGAQGQQTNNAAPPNPLESQPQPLEGTTVGGNIIGVGSKIKKPSFRIYLGGDTYQEWEFIWNPNTLVAVPGQTPASPSVNPAGAPSPANPGNPAGGQQLPQTPPMPGENMPPPTQPAR